MNPILLKDTTSGFYAEEKFPFLCANLDVYVQGYTVCTLCINSGVHCTHLHSTWYDVVEQHETEFKVYN